MVPSAGGASKRGGAGGARVGGRPARPRVSGWPLTRDVGDVGEELGGAVAALDRLEQLGRLVDEAGGVARRREHRMREDVFEEGEVGGDAADAELAQRPVHAGDGFLGVGAQAVTFSSSGS